MINISKLTLYCPIKLYLFSGLSLDEFNDLDLDYQGIWMDAEIKSEQETWTNTINSMLKKFINESRRNLSFDYIPHDDKYETIRHNIFGNAICLEQRGDKNWLAVCYDLRSPVRNEDMVLMKEYATEQFLELEFNLGGYNRNFEAVSDGVFVYILDAADYYSGTNEYDIDGNRLLLGTEMKAMKINAMYDPIIDSEHEQQESESLSLCQY